MTVVELMRILEKFRPDAKVVIPGLATGYDDLADAVRIDLELTTDPHWWEGKYSKLSDQSLSIVSAVMLVSE